MNNPFTLVSAVSIAVWAGAMAPATTQAAIPTSQREALIAFYNSTDGPNWWFSGGSWQGAPGTECSWHGITCNSTQTGVVEIELDHNRLGGVLPPEIGDLVDLERLILNNNQISGELPPEIGNLIHLTDLIIWANNFTGPIPPEIGNLVNLREINCIYCELSGPIPPEFGNLTALEKIYIPGNGLTGPLPAELGSLSSLRSLDLWGNQLTGPIPPELGALTALEVLRLEGNALIGSIPPALAGMAPLLELNLSYNQLDGAIPAELGNLAAIETLSLAGNRLEGPIPPELANAQTLMTLHLADNRLTGTIPEALGSMPNLDRLSLEENMLRGPIPVSLGNFCAPGVYLLLELNALDTPDPALADALDQCSGAWRRQGVPPTDPVAVEVAPRWAAIAWTPIEWTEAGSYRVLVKTGDDALFLQVPTTGLVADKEIDLVTVAGLQPDTTYTVVIQSISYPVESGNTIVSNQSTELVITTLPAETYHVSTTGDDLADCLSPSTACRTIQAAIDRAASGDAVRVAPGVYTENIVIDRDLAIRGTTAATTVIDGGGIGTVVLVGSGTTVELRNLTITNGLATSGGGVFNSGATLFVLDSEISANHAISDGGAFFNQGGLLVVENSTIAENTAGSGAVLGTPETEVEPGVTGFRNSTLSGNVSTHVHSRVISPATLFNCTVSANRAGLFGYILEGGPDSYPHTGPTSRLQHTAIGGNASPNCRTRAGKYMGYNYSDTEECFTGDYSLDWVVPNLLLAPLESNGGPTRTHALLPGSPVIDAGDNDGAPIRDQRGLGRPMDGDGDGFARVDPGAFELQSGLPLLFADGFEYGDLSAWSGGSR